MKVIQTGNVFSASRVTGPTHHFLSVEFGRSCEGCEFRIAETQEILSDETTIACLQRALEDCSENFPIHGKFEVRCLTISQHDKSNEEAYKVLLRKIVSFADVLPE